jgi:hypothetical protein
MTNKSSSLNEISEEWNKVMIQSPVISDDKGTIQFLGKEGGQVVVDSKSFLSSILVVIYPEPK